MAQLFINTVFLSLKGKQFCRGCFRFSYGISLLQDCKDFHQAKDGDGWVEQSSQPFFLGLLQKVYANNSFWRKLGFKNLLDDIMDKFFFEKLSYIIEEVCF